MIRTLAAFVFAVGIATAQNPDPGPILEAARMSATFQEKQDLHGYLSKNGSNTPIHLFFRHKDIQFVVDEKGGSQRFHLRFGDDRYDLFELAPDGKTTAFPDSKISQSIAGTDVTYEDLSFRFLYWPSPVYEGQEDVNNQPCHKLRINKPKGTSGRYEVVYVWIHTKQGAFMRVRGHDKKGALVKEFEVREVMKLDNGSYTLKRMEVSGYTPGSDRRSGVTTLTFDKPQTSAAPTPKGLKR